MSDFKAKVHQIRLWLDLAEGAYSAPLDPVAEFKGSTSKGREEEPGEGREGKGKERGEGEGRRRRKGEGREEMEEKG